MHLPLALVVAFPLPVVRPEFDRKEDVIYGRKFGMCLTMDVYVPKAKQNGAGVVYAVSGGWFSGKQAIPPASSTTSSSAAGTWCSPSTTAASRGSRFPRPSMT